MELPRYPTTTPVRMPEESIARQSATALLIVETVLLGISLPIQLLVFLSLGWEGGDEALKHRLLDVLPLLGTGALAAAVLAGVAASSVWRDAGERNWLTGITAGLVALLGIGWAAALQGSLFDPLLGPVWVVLTAPAPVALALVLVVRHRARRTPASPRR